MASQTAEFSTDSAQISRYRTSWTTMNALLKQGNSWSGNEPNCAYLNPAGSGKMVNVSAITGLDFTDDGRGLALTDWDADGDLDIWVSNRTAPSVRYLENQSGQSGQHFIAVQLVGKTCNRDAIGARVELVLGADQPPLLRSIRAGEGYVTQSSKWAHFGLGEKPAIDHLIVHWPGGERETFNNISADHRYQLHQGTGIATPVPRREMVAIPNEPTQNPKPSETAARVFAYSRLPFPTTSVTDFEGHSVGLATGNTPKLINLWGSWCAPCLKELSEFAKARSALQSAGIEVLALSVDRMNGNDGNAAQALAKKQKWPFSLAWADDECLIILEAIQRTLSQDQQPLPLPSSLLLDQDGCVAAVYRGPITVADLLADAQRLKAPVDRRLSEASPFDGLRTLKPTPLDPMTLAYKLFEGGYTKAVENYLHQLVQLVEKQRPGSENIDKNELYYFLAGLYQDSGRIAESAQTYKRLLAFAPDHAKANRNLGRLLMRSNQIAPAIPFLNQAITRDPNDFDTYLELATSYFQLGQFAQSVNVLSRLLSKNAKHPGGAQMLAWMLATSPDPKTRDAEKALAWAQHALRLTKQETPAGIDVLAAAYAEAGRFPEAIAEAKKAITLAEQQSLPPTGIAMMRQRLASYESKKPWRTDVPGR